MNARAFSPHPHSRSRLLPSPTDYGDDMRECDDMFKKPKLKLVSLKIDPHALAKIIDTFILCSFDKIK